MSAPETFLSEVSVVELGSRGAVGAAGSLLAQLGATVISVEPSATPRHGKWVDRAVATAGKKSIVLDVGDDFGAIVPLLAGADVILISSDVDSNQLSLWHDGPVKAVVCDITAFGHTGPLAGQALSEGLVEAMSGIVETTGLPDEPPTPIGTPLLEIHAALYAVGAVLAARRLRRFRSAGERIDVALFDVGVTALVNFLPLFLDGRPATRSGNRHPLYTPWNTYAAADGTLQICTVSNQHWRTLCEIMQRLDLIEDPRFVNTQDRLDHVAELDGYVGEWVATMKLADCEQLLVESGIACGPILEIGDQSNDTNIRYRDSLVRVHDPCSGDQVLLAASPFRALPFSGLTPAAIPEPDADRTLIFRSSRAEPTDLPKIPPGSVNRRPLEGVRIIEIGHYTVAPLASRIMGALGADVIKVESPIGDAIRKGPPTRLDGSSYVFAISNTDKRGIVLDLREEKDRALLHELLAGADALIENLKPSSLARLGFDTATLRKRHPNLIYCTVTGFGSDSAYQARSALDTVVQAMSGLMDCNRSGGYPVKTGISASDNLGGQFAFVAICAALELRDRTGIAAHFDLSMQDASVWATQLEWERRSERPAIVPAADGYVAVEGESRRAEAAPKQSRKQITAEYPPNGAAPVLSVDEVLNHPQTRARDLMVERPTPRGDRWVVFSLPFKLHGTRTDVVRVLGRLGETDQEIREELNGRRHAKSTPVSAQAPS